MSEGPTAPLDGRGRPVSRRKSLDRRLPLLNAVIVSAAVAVLVAGSYRTIEDTLLASASLRASTVARELQALLRESVAQRRAEARAAADDGAVRAFLAAPGEERRGAAKAALAVPAQLPAVLGVELWSGGGDLLLVVQPPGSGAPPRGPEARPPDSEGPSPIHATEGTVSYRMVALVEPEPGSDAASGFLSVRRSLSSGRTADSLRRLIGSGARFYLGNADGGVWTDLGGAVPPPVPADALRPGEPPSFDKGGDRLGLSLAVEGSPWLLWLDIPRAAALAPAGAFLRRVLWIALGVIVAGAVAGRLLSRRITGPLDQLTAAAEGLAAGEIERAVPMARRDEIGRLGRAFDRMRQEVMEGRQGLELRVEERTQELKETMRKLEETREELVRQERLATLGQLASSVGHELRNPLAVMTNALFYLEMLLEGPTEEVREYLGILRHEIGLSEKIVGDLLDFARVKTPQRQDVPLPALVEHQLHRLGLLEGITVERHFDEGLAAAAVDPVQAGQVVLNLVTNAMQAMEGQDGHLTVRGQPDGPGFVRLEVRDTGPGVPEEIRHQIFEPLFTTRARGLGLGLAVSRRLAEANGGSLSLEAPPGPGALFVLRLPASEGPPR